MAPLPNVLSGLAFLDQVTQPTFYPDLLGRFDTFYDEVDAMIARRGIPVQVPRHGARFGILVGLDHPPIDYRDALCHRKDLWLAFIRHAFERGVYFHDYGGGPCHHGFGAAHSQQDIDSILQVMDEAFGEIATEF
jgi:glutamate-1-semialdehyde aminotransferase